MFGYQSAFESKTNLAPQKCLNDGIQGLGNSLDRLENKCVKFSVHGAHPLESKEKNYLSAKHEMNMNMLRNVQGIHAPLRISMELRANKKVGRLPFMASSNLSSDIIMGRDDTIDFSDILYPADVHEQLNRPYVAMERL
ncbi:proteasome maturation protein [Planococcus citri]|uniref:proteasome maturation protein n=1 Tax=Planococcus citri TaxID=170843 RepID=UPI0031F84A46